MTALSICLESVSFTLVFMKLRILQDFLTQSWRNRVRDSDEGCYSVK